MTFQLFGSRKNDLLSFITRKLGNYSFVLNCCVGQIKCPREKIIQDLLKLTFEKIEVFEVFLLVSFALFLDSLSVLLGIVSDYKR